MNNPINRINEKGNISGLATASVAVGAVLCVAAVTILTGGVTLGPVMGIVATGAAKGALIGAVLGTTGGAGVGYAVTGTLQGTIKGAAIGFGTGALIGAIVGGISSGLKYAKANEFKIKELGRLEASNHPGDSQLGIKYTVKKPNGSTTTRSLEFHYNHEHKGYKKHWQLNQWNPRFDSSSGKKYWTWWGKRI